MLRSEKSGLRPDGEEDLLGRDRLGLVADRVGDGVFRLLVGDALHGGAGDNLDACGCDLLLKHSRDLLVHAGDEAREHLDDGDLGAHADQELGELHPDDAAADDDDALRQGFHGQDLVGVHDVGAVDSLDGDPAGLRARGDEDLVALDFFARLADLNGLRVDEGRRSLDDLHLLGLQQGAHAAGELGHDGVLAGHDGAEVHFIALASDAEHVRLFHRPGNRRRLQERLGGDAAPVEARASQGVFFYERHLGAHAGRTDRGRIPSHAAADDGDSGLVCHEWSPLSYYLILPGEGPAGLSAREGLTAHITPGSGPAPR